MKKDFYLVRQRDRAICQHFWQLIRQGMPCMRAYSHTAQAYYLSEKRVRDIVREQRNPRNATLR